MFGPTGDQVTIYCLDYMTEGDKLYCIEEKPEEKEKCILTVRTLKIDKEVVSPIEKSISLDRKASLEKVCSNGQIVLLSKQYFDRSPIFIDLNSQKVTYTQHEIPSYAENFIPDSGELWTWDELTKKIWKISSTNATIMGILDSGRGTTFLHVDEKDQLYFV